MPPHPQIHAEAMLEVFVHRSIRFPGVPLNAETAYGDADRLAILGGKMLQLAYASVLFDQRSLLNAADLEVRSLPTKPNVDMYILKLSSDTGVWSSTGGIRKARRERRPVGDRVSVEGQGPARAGRGPEHPRSTSSVFADLFLSLELSMLKESRTIMNAYVGAVFLGEGFETISRWVIALVEYSAALQRNG